MVNAVSLHSGSVSFGHYTAYVRTPDGRCWDCNDSWVQEISSMDYADSRAYVLSYSFDEVLPKTDIVVPVDELVHLAEKDFFPAPQAYGYNYNSYVYNHNNSDNSWPVAGSRSLSENPALTNDNILNNDGVGEKVVVDAKDE